MLVSEFLTATNYALRGIDGVAPTIGSEEATYWIATLNRKINELYTNSKILWDSTWSVESLGAITASATPSFASDATLIAPSDEVYAVDTNSNTIYYDVIKPRQRPHTGRQFYLAGVNPQTLYCTNAITATEDIVGGTLYLPGYYMPAEVSGASDVLPLPDPYWGVMATAFEVAFGDITYEDKTEGLNIRANALMMQMTRNNRRHTYGATKKPPTVTYQIKSPEER